MSRQDHNERLVLVTGANRGIGRAIAEEFLAHGYRLSLGARDPAQLERVFGPSTERLAYHRYDAADPATAESWVRDTVAQFGRIDVLINNAGVNKPVVTLREGSEADLDLLWAINVKAPLRMTRLCLPHLEAGGEGRIVNVASLSGKRVRNARLGYTMTKFAVMGLTHTTRLETWDKGVRVTALCPGFASTDMTAAYTQVPRDDMTSPQALARLARTVVELPNNAAVAELLVNCRREDTL
jgi:NAD(P)-dependent dehydrogenase (short-subunit alcohol dehydrogenase family)